MVPGIRAEAAGEGQPRGRQPFAGRRAVPLAGLALVAAALAAYSGTFSCPFIMDDAPGILLNPTITQGWGALFPPPGSPVAGRPVLNLSYALNYALGGYGVGGYHALNLLVHALNGLLVFGIVRRTLGRPALSARFGPDSLTLAFLSAALWVVHPLDTEAVTYVSERAESLMGFFYLATVYLFVRGAGGPRPVMGCALSVAACLLGALTKEVIATAPLIVLLYDRTFLAGTFRGALRQRWAYYLGLAAALLPLSSVSLASANRGVGFGYGVGWWPYLLTSCRSVALYLKLSVWPHPLVLDYGRAIVAHPGGVAPYALALAAALAFSAVALLRWPAVGFACAWFFVILAPTSSVIPLAFQPMAEHRAYLSLVAVACLAVLGVHRLLGRGGAVMLVAAVLLLGWLTFERNTAYRSALSIWSDTVEKCPGNPRALVQLGAALAATPGREGEAVPDYREALRIDPGYAEAHNDLGLALAITNGRLPEAVAEFEAAVRIRPGYLEARDNLGMALSRIPGRLPEAISAYEAALRVDPGYAKAHNDMGVALAGSPGRMKDAIVQFEAALRAKPGYADAMNNLALARQMATDGR